jgi:hypothetical protein
MGRAMERFWVAASLATLAPRNDGVGVRLTPAFATTRLHVGVRAQARSYKATKRERAGCSARRFSQRPQKSRSCVKSLRRPLARRLWRRAFGLIALPVQRAPALLARALNVHEPESNDAMRPRSRANQRLRRNREPPSPTSAFRSSKTRQTLRVLETRDQHRCRSCVCSSLALR